MIRGKHLVAFVRGRQADVDANGELADQFAVKSIPSPLLFKAGECVDRLVGKVPCIKVVRAVEKHGVP